MSFEEVAPRYARDSRAQRSAAERLVALADLGPAEDVLDVGCGTGALVARLRAVTRGRVVGVDPSARMLEEARRAAPPAVELACLAAAVSYALATGAGHSFYLVLGPGAYPINVLDRIKACQEVCRVFCATANPLQALVARTDQGAGIVGVVDGFSPKGVEDEAGMAERSAMLRRFGYKFA